MKETIEHIKQTLKPEEFKAIEEEFFLLMNDTFTIKPGMAGHSRPSIKNTSPIVV